MKKVDARGLSCPEPVIRAKNAMESGDKEYEIQICNTSGISGTGNRAGR